MIGHLPVVFGRDISILYGYMRHDNSDLIGAGA